MTKTIKKIILLVTCVLTNLLFIFLMEYVSRNYQMIRFSNGLMIPGTSFQGTIQAIISLICYLMVFIDYKKGRFVAYGLLALVILHNCLTIIQQQILTPVPGVLMVFVSFFTVTILYKFYAKQSRNSVTDYVTGLPNRRKFVEDVENLVQEKKNFYLANFAIRDFTRIVDAYGLKAGDFILKVASERITKILGHTSAYSYRIGGSNFMIVFMGTDNPAGIVEEIIEAVKNEMVIPKIFSVSGNTETSCYPVLACGISKYDGKTNEYASTFNRSELALSLARRNNSQNIFVYDEKMKQDQDNQFEAEKLIIESIQNDYFYLVYQPQFEITEKKLRGFETLIRCKKPDGTIVSPAFYIPVAEKSNLILEIDDYVLNRAMKEFKPVLETIPQKITISVNVSAKNFSKEDFAEKVFRCAEETKFPLDCLEIEITEYSLAESLETTIKNINILREKGVQIALDDFGTGYTSIAQLMNLPINLLKIDKSLVDDIENNQRSRDLVDSVIYMGHVMNCEVISEGVETEAQLSILEEHKCNFVQGYVWGKPMSYEDAVELSRKG